MDVLAGLAATGAASMPLFAMRPDGLEALLSVLSPRHATQARAQNFTGQSGECLFLAEETGLKAAVLGLGVGPALHGFGAAPFLLPPGSVWRIESGMFDACDAALGFLLGAYQYDRFKTGYKKPRVPALLAPASVPARAVAVAAAIYTARSLINTPPNLLGPADLADAAVKIAENAGGVAARITGPALEARYPAIAAVGAGSERPPAVVILEWSGSRAGDSSPKISLCGKGVCFDTGGYDIKPSAAMLRMKKDMGGAAIVLGLAQAVMTLDLPVHMRVRLGCVENSISGRAMRPSDVLQTRAGHTVEIGNTDAEGRLVLCDLLAEAASEHPDWLIDAATLTGAARVALGPDIPALFCTNDEFSERLLAAGAAVHDPLWRLPLHAGYESWLDSPVADFNTVAQKPFAGAIVAALFLKKFVPDHLNWAHLDVYAWNESNRPGRPEGGEAQGLRALLQAIETLIGIRK